VARTRGIRPGGWPIVGGVGLALLGMVAAILAAHGADEAGVRLVIRATAWTSLALFLPVFTASALRRAAPASPTAAWLLANRRYLGVSFGVSHLLHLGAILALFGGVGGLLARAETATLVLGGLGYVAVVALVATSFDATAARLGPRAWRRLHLTGVWTLWAIFFATLAPSALVRPSRLPLVALLLAAAVVRRAYRPPPVPAPAGGDPSGWARRRAGS